jgi:hypothetical protein
MSSHSKYTAWCPLPEASDVDRRSYVDWGFRCRLRPSRLDIGKTEARHEKSSWRLSISGRHDARRAARVSVWECSYSSEEESCPTPPGACTHAFEPIQDGRIYIEKLNGPFLYIDRGSLAEYSAGLKFA